MGVWDDNKFIKEYEVSDNSNSNPKDRFILLQILQNKKKKNQLLRLRRYRSWFVIDSSEQLRKVLSLLSKGSKIINWSFDSTEFENQLKENTVSREKSETLSTSGSNSHEVIENIIIDLKNSNDPEYIVGIIKILEEAVVQSDRIFKESFKVLLDKISTEDAVSIQQLSGLLEHWNLKQITSVSNIVKERLETLDLFEEMIHNENTYEINTDKSIHRVLENNLWIYDDKFWIVRSNKSLRDFIGEEIVKENKAMANKRPDFVCADFENKLYILELKRPSLTLKKEEIMQAQRYLMYIRKYKGKNYSGIKAILLGNKISDEAYDYLETVKNIEIRTYQEFLNEARKRYTEYQKIVEKKL